MFAILVNEDGQYGTIALCPTAAGTRKVVSCLLYYGGGEKLQIVDIESGKKFYSLDEFQRSIDSTTAKEPSCNCDDPTRCGHPSEYNIGRKYKPIR